jgi:hypothetical protein
MRKEVGNFGQPKAVNGKPVNPAKRRNRGVLARLLHFNMFLRGLP